MNELTGVLGRETREARGSLWGSIFGDGLRCSLPRTRGRERAGERVASRPFPDAEAERDVWFALGRGCCEI